MVYPHHIYVSYDKVLRRIWLSLYGLPFHPVQRWTDAARDTQNRISVALDASQTRRPLRDSYSAQTCSNWFDPDSFISERLRLNFEKVWTSWSYLCFFQEWVRHLYFEIVNPNQSSLDAFQVNEWHSDSTKACANWFSLDTSPINESHLDCTKACTNQFSLDASPERERRSDF